MEAVPSPKGGARERGLEREAVVAAALGLLDEVGFGGLTLRRLAERLDVKAAALYWHFENKQDLLDAMAERIMLNEFQRSAPPDVAWRELLAGVARTHRAALLRYRDGAQVLAHANVGNDALLAGLESLLQKLQTQGFSPQLATVSFFAVVRFTLGCVFEEQSDPRAHASPSQRAQRLLYLAGKFPAIAQAFGATFPQPGRSHDVLFESGLRLILDGIGAQLEKQLDGHGHTD